MRHFLAIALLLLVPSLTLAAHGEAPTHPAPHGGAEASYPAPEIAAPSHWPGVMVLVIGGLFVAAIAVGLVVRVNMPAEPPQDHAVHQGHGEDTPGHEGHTTDPAHH